MLKIQIGHASNAKYGPVISYIEIYRQADTTDLEAEMDACKDYKEDEYDSKTWSAFATAKQKAQEVLNNSADLTNISTINDAHI